MSKSILHTARPLTAPTCTTQQALDHRAPPRQQQQQLISGESSASSSPYGWSLTSAHSPMAASAPRSVWVPASPRRQGGHGHGHGHGLGLGYGGRANSQLRLVDFCLPTWAGLRTSCGCLSHTEVTWGKEGVAPGVGAGVGSGLGGGGLSGGAARSLGPGGPASGIVGAGGLSPLWQGVSEYAEVPFCLVGSRGRGGGISGHVLAQHVGVSPFGHGDSLLLPSPCLPRLTTCVWRPVDDLFVGTSVKTHLKSWFRFFCVGGGLLFVDSNTTIPRRTLSRLEPGRARPILRKR